MNKEIKIQFHKDIEEIADHAIAAYGLRYEKTAAENLHDNLLRWSDFILRYIPHAKRIIIKSDRFSDKLPQSALAGLKRIERLFIDGGDVNSFQSRGLTDHNDTSGKQRRNRTDALWADWGIHHLHLPETDTFTGERYSTRGDWLLFLRVYDNAVLFIDIKSHDNKIEPDLFSQRDLIETFIRNWPSEAENFEIKGVLGATPHSVATDKEIGQLRRAGVNTPIQFNGKIYMSMGMGITTASTATSTSIYCNRIHSYADDIAKYVSNPDGEFMTEFRKFATGEPEFKIILLPSGELGILDVKRDVAWRLHREDPVNSRNVYCLFSNALLPEWAVKRVADYCFKKNQLLS